MFNMEATMTSLRYLGVVVLAVAVASCDAREDATGPVSERADQQVSQSAAVPPYQLPQDAFSRRDAPWWNMSDEELTEWVEAAAGKVMIGFKDPGTAAGVDDYGRVLTSQNTVADGLTLLRAIGAEILDEFRLMPGVAARIDPSLVAALRAEPIIDYIEPVTRGEWVAQTTTWNVHRVNAPDAWTQGTGAGQKLLIVDSGIDDQHADLNPYVIQGCDGSNGLDELGHGTHVSGISAAVDNTIGVVGVAHGVELWSSKVGTFAPETDAVRCAIEFARINDVFAANMSLTVTASIALTDEIKAAYGEGHFLVAAAGNENGPVRYPAVLAEVVAVGATGSNNARWSSSNHGEELELAAPGVDILSTCLGGGTCQNTGTSMAAPHVAAAGALVKSVHTTWSNVQIRNRLQETAKDLGTAGRDDFYGYGLLDVAAAVGLGDPPVVTISGPTRIQPGATCTWDAVVTSGDPPFTYYWTGQVQPYGTRDPWYTGSKDSGQLADYFTLRVDVSNVAGSDFDQITVYEDPDAPICII